MIRRIGLTNFKCFASLTMELKPLNVLMGLNGMGKSSVLQSLLLLRQSYQETALAQLKLNGRYVSLGNGSDILYEQAEEEKIGIFVEEEKCLQTVFSYSANAELLENERRTDKPDEESVLFGNRFVYLSAYRIEPRDLYRIADDKVLGNKEFSNSGEFAIHYLQAYGDKDIKNKYVVFNSLDDRSLNRQVRQWMSLIAPGIMPQITVNAGLRTAELRYEFREGNEKTNAYKSVNVGFGITYVLPVVIAILSAEPGDILLLENPEAHIHPAGQRWLGELMALAAQGGVQILAETHSDHILNGIRIAAKKKSIDCGNVGIFFFYKDDQDDYRHKVCCPKLDENGKIDVWPEGFLDEWDQALMELL